jgi:hypothetical protein
MTNFVYEITLSKNLQEQELIVTFKSRSHFSAHSLYYDAQQSEDARLIELLKQITSFQEGVLSGGSNGNDIKYKVDGQIIGAKELAKNISAVFDKEFKYIH